MICAIYARKSTEQTGVTDEGKSVTRQVEHAKAYAKSKGWHVAEDHIYSDDGISGAEFVRRPGFIRLMNAVNVKPKPPFQVLVMSEESRLGREQIQTAYALQQVTDAGVRVFFYLTDQERTLNTAMDKVMLSLTNFAAEMERDTELAVLDGLAVTPFDPVRVEEELRSYLKDWSGLAQRHPAQSRQILRKLLPNRVRVWREIRGGEKVYRFEGEAAVGKLFHGVVNIERSGVPNGI